MSGLRRALLALGAGGIAFGLATAVVIATSDHVEYRGLETVLALLIGWGFIAAGVVAWWRRPENNFGPLMTLTGYLFFLSELAASDSEVVFAIAGLLGNLFLAVVIHMLLAMPSGKLRSSFERRFVVAIYVFFSVPSRAFLLLDSSSCEGCPSNVVASEQTQALAGDVDRAINVAVLIIFAAVLYLLARHWQQSNQVERRAIRPVFITGTVILLVLFAGVLGEIFGDAEFAKWSYYATQAAILPLPYVFLVSLARGRFSRGEAVSELVARLGSSPERVDVRAELARALGDPSLELAYWLQDAGRYADAGGRPMEPPAPGSGRTYTPIELEGRPVAAMIHDPALDADGELLGAVGGAAALALENARLEAELRAHLEELRASRTRIVEAGYAERRRVERDLHDGAQQRLVSLALNLRLAQSTIREDPGKAEGLLEGAGQDLEQALAELRELARGIHPGVLSDRGLGAALESLASRAPLPVELADVADGRLPQAMESAAYFVVAEALTNVAKYAGASRATVKVTSVNGSLAVEISDDGVGGADPRSGSGLRGLSDRVAALGGRLDVQSPPGEGTTVRATIPLEG